MDGKPELRRKFCRRFEAAVMYTARDIEMRRQTQSCEIAKMAKKGQTSAGKTTIAEAVSDRS